VQETGAELACKDAEVARKDAELMRKDAELAQLRLEMAELRRAWAADVQLLQSAVAVVGGRVRGHPKVGKP
jgi:uncharacterized protein (DUF3084 family)